MRSSSSGFVRNYALLLCLLTPSVWMIATIPPLWRDMDAYNQVTQPPLVTTFWGHGPAYCYAAKIPLFLGEQFERRWQGTMPASHGTELSHPVLTNTGVWLLIIAQHLGLCGAAFYFLLAVSKFFPVRLALALAWASSALFYTFAHSIGSESLSMIAVLLMVSQSLRLIQSQREPQWKDWYGFAIALGFCILCRHVNLWLILLLPAAFLVSWIQNRIAGFFARGDKQARRLRRHRTRNLRQAVIAIATGIACLVMTTTFLSSLAYKTRLHPHSRLGFTFLWRLHFLKDLSQESRAALLQKVAARRNSEDTRKLITLLQQMEEEDTVLNASQFMLRAIPLLFPEGRVEWKRLDEALNQMAFAFLLPPTPEHLRAARTDFVAALKMPVTEISSYLFQATAYYFEHKDEMPSCAELTTFRDASADQLLQIPSQHLYFRLWRGLTYNKALVTWFICLLVFVVMARRTANVRAISAFGIALIGIGLLMTASTCLLGEFIPRYGLPMWQLLLLSLYIFVGRTADLFVITCFKRPSRQPHL